MNQNNVKTLFVPLLCALCLALAGCTQRSGEEAKPSGIIAVTHTPAAIITLNPTVSPTPAPTAAPSPTPTPDPTPAPTGLLLDRFAERFVQGTGSSLRTKDSYRSDRVSFTVTKHFDKDSYSNYITYFVVDIYVQDIECLQTACADTGGNFSAGGMRKLEKIARNAGALVATNGDYFSYNNKGLVIRNGVLYRNKLNGLNDICVLFRDGSMKTYTADGIDVDAVMEQGAWQAWNFGPALFDEEGNPKTEFHKDYNQIDKRNPRTMIGYYEPGHYCLVVVDGRDGGYSLGLSMKELAQLAKDLGCVDAYNLDGGQTTQLYWNDKIYNEPYKGGRSTSDIVCIVDP